MNHHGCQKPHLILWLLNRNPQNYGCSLNLITYNDLWRPENPKCYMKNYTHVYQRQSSVSAVTLIHVKTVKTPNHLSVSQLCSCYYAKQPFNVCIKLINEIHRERFVSLWVWAYDCFIWWPACIWCLCNQGHIRILFISFLNCPKQKKKPKTLKEINLHLPPNKPSSLESWPGSVVWVCCCQCCVSCEVRVCWYHKWTDVPISSVVGHLHLVWRLIWACSSTCVSVFVSGMCQMYWGHWKAWWKRGSVVGVLRLDMKEEESPWSGLSAASEPVAAWEGSWTRDAGSSLCRKVTLCPPLPPTWLYGGPLSGRKLKSCEKSIREEDKAKESPAGAATDVDILDRDTSSLASSSTPTSGTNSSLEEESWGSWASEAEDGILLCSSIR